MPASLRTGSRSECCQAARKCWLLFTIPGGLQASAIGLTGRGAGGKGLRAGIRAGMQWNHQQFVGVASAPSPFPFVRVAHARALGRGARCELRARIETHAFVTCTLVNDLHQNRDCQI